MVLARVFSQTLLKKLINSFIPCKVLKAVHHPRMKWLKNQSFFLGIACAYIVDDVVKTLKFRPTGLLQVSKKVCFSVI